MKTYNVHSAQRGFAAGNAFVYQRKAMEPYMVKDISAELQKLRDAFVAYENILLERAKGGNETEKELSEIEIALMRSPDFAETAEELVRTGGSSAPEALSRTEAQLCRKFLDSGNDYIIARCEDIRGICAGLKTFLCKGNVILPEAPYILVASELSPGELSFMDDELLMGIVTESGSDTSHVSVLAGNMGIPYVYGIKDIYNSISADEFLILDSESGSVVVSPDEACKAAAIQRWEREKEKRTAIIKNKCNESLHTGINVNIGSLKDIEKLEAANADGVGLFRSEFLYLNRNAEPSEEEQYEAYSRAAAIMGERETVIRTMDIGADKKVPWLAMKNEPNPALGLRGIRVSLSRKDLLRTQLRAILRAGVKGNIKIMLPMIASEWEIDAVREEMEDVAGELDRQGVAHRIPQIGIMIETPAAVMIADSLAQKVGFFSIGTNDLTQYTLALDREAQGLDLYYDPLHEAVLKMIDHTVQAAHRNQIPVAVCGELASHPDAIPRLISSGVDVLSVSIGKLDEVRNRVFEIESETDSAEVAVAPEGAVTAPAESSAATAGVVTAPADGELVLMQDIPDKAFSSGMVGECLGIRPEDGKIYAPCSGRIGSVAKTKHAITVQSDQGQEFLIHAGIDTVNLKGEGFSIDLQEGDRVRQGQLIMTMDPGLIRSKGYDPMVIIVKLK